MESFIERPTGPAPCRRLAVLVLDGSSSMHEPVGAPEWRGSKAEAVATAATDLLTLVRVSSGAAALSLGAVSITDRVVERWGPVPALEVEPAEHPYRPGGTGTSLAAGLAEAERQVQRFLAAEPRGLPSSVTVLLLSDGRCGTPAESRRVAARLNADPRVTLACALFDGEGDAAGRELLAEMSSAPVWSTSTHDRGSLPRYFWACLATRERGVAGHGRSA